MSDLVLRLLSTRASEVSGPKVSQRLLRRIRLGGKNGGFESRAFAPNRHWTTSRLNAPLRMRCLR